MPSWHPSWADGTKATVANHWLCLSPAARLQAAAVKDGEGRCRTNSAAGSCVTPAQLCSQPRAHLSSRWTGLPAAGREGEASWQRGNAILPPGEAAVGAPDSSPAAGGTESRPGQSQMPLCL